MTEQKPNRILVQFGSTVYAYAVGEFTCKDCDIDNCESIREMCCRLNEGIGQGAFFRRDLMVTYKGGG